MSGHRRAAAALHALAEADRAAILARLPAPDQAMLRGYLDELQALGFQSEGADFGALDAPPARLELAPAGMVFSVLEHEPAVLVAQVLALQQWPWEAEVLALCTSARRDLIRAAGAQPPAPARARFLREALEARLSGGAPSHAGDTAPIGVAAARKWWRPWRR